MNLNYSKTIKKNSIGRRIVISWIVVAVIFFLIGLGIGMASSGSSLATNSKPEREILIFNKTDGKTFEGKVSPKWISGDLNFIPLNVPMDEDLQEFTFYLSAAYKMDFTFVMALIQKESGFQADVVSETNDYGLMQINETNHAYLKEQLGITDFLNPYDNIRAGMFIMQKLFKKYETTEKVLMAYNMGEDGAKRLWEKNIFATDYTQDILAIQQQFKEQLKGN